MRWLAGVMLLALAAPTPGVAQDSSVVVQGLLVQPPTERVWLLALPTPFRHRERLIAELEVAGRSARWSALDGRYVEARGKIALPADARARPTLRADGIREVDPEGTVRKNVSESFTHRVSIVLWPLPRRFAWVDATGRPTGVGPVLVYTINNHGESDVTLEFESQDFVCFTVEPIDVGAPPWRHSRRLEQPTDRLRVTLPKFVREVARLPRAAAPEPGRYRVRAGLCGFKEYELETEIEVLR